MLAHLYKPHGLGGEGMELRVRTTQSPLGEETEHGVRDQTRLSDPSAVKPGCANKTEGV